MEYSLGYGILVSHESHGSIAGIHTLKKSQYCCSWHCFLVSCDPKAVWNKKFPGQGWGRITQSWSTQNFYLKLKNNSRKMLRMQ